MTSNRSKFILFTLAEEIFLVAALCCANLVHARLDAQGMAVEIGVLVIATTASNAAIRLVFKRAGESDLPAGAHMVPVAAASFALTTLFFFLGYSLAGGMGGIPLSLAGALGLSATAGASVSAAALAFLSLQGCE